ncbi:putative ribokinase protein [Fusarium austroafricanum]|uniref:Putative ribokinase protein n=1 Tax=Fusarium austroafricanum TaxID=2364996 RepID=A0A8H4JTM3_9HYPO|nr:putative ribokinase protein [Fusarium austroafricanum]
MSQSPLCVKVVGSMNWDIINRVDSHYGGWQHASFPNGAPIDPSPGGHGVNQAIAVYRASHQSSPNSCSLPNGREVLEDVQVYMIGMIGEDDDNRGQKIKNALADDGVHVEGVHQARNIRNGYAHIYVDMQGTPRIHNDPLANGRLTWDVVEAELEKSPRADLILVQLEIPQETVVKTIDYANKNQIPIIFNSAPVSARASNLYSHPLIFQVDHLILNHHCVEAICRTRAPRSEHSLDDGMISVPNIQKLYAQYCDHFHRLGARCVVITLGHRGVLASYLEPPDANGDRGQRTFFYPAKKQQQELVDETGASDAFIGAYAAEILRQMKTPANSGLNPVSLDLDIGTAIEHGIKAGSLTTESFGSFPAIPWRRQWIGSEVQWLTANPFVLH